MLVTLDTNVVRDRIEQRRDGHEEAMRIAALIRDGTIRAQVTTRIRVDVPDNPLKAMVDELPELSEERAGAPVRLGFTILTGEDYLTTESETQEATALVNLLFPGSDPSNPRHRNRLADVDHLLAHRRSPAKWFLTSEKAILHYTEALQDEYAIKVVSPTDFLDRRLWQ